MTYLHCMQPEQRTQITNIVGGVHISNCSQYFPNEPLYGLWNNIPIGFTAAFSLGCFDYPDSSVNLIDCRDAVAFDEFLKGLPQKQIAA
ncbi:hypothetical protein ADIARSV_0153 [Arcticibacter svalbardensis MN12-7]|uniref:Uncharacterized protein n=1 Tax=Arcticibacter svalbardensis MN12-7 TaxID=1150600 RepID=R9GZ18_9SPHI|nr:hypothetical protein [Arcticibacter svalbardensis]EOR96730.1 hypothetical protein ADIARSV_0153 [Arcticibacter svalbardensis MN12-7]